MDEAKTEAAVLIVPEETTPPDIATLASTLTAGAKREGASTREAIATALKLAAQVKSVPPAEK